MFGLKRHASNVVSRLLSIILPDKQESEFTINISQSFLRKLEPLSRRQTAVLTSHTVAYARATQSSSCQYDYNLACDKSTDDDDDDDDDNDDDDDDDG